MLITWFSLFIGFFSFFIFFGKKLLSLLFIEVCFMLIISLFFILSYNSISDSSFFVVMIFLSFMVLDSVLGLCCLVVSSRNSTSFLSSFVS